MHLKNKHPDVSNKDGLVLKCSSCSFKTVNMQNYETHIFKHKEQKKVDSKQKLATGHREEKIENV